MGKGSSGPTESTVTQTDLPDYAQPYVERLFQRSESESLRPYDAYQGQRLADTAGETQQARDMVQNLGPGITGLPMAQNATQGAMGATAGIMGMGNPMSQYGFNPVDQFTGQNVSNYMSPYMQNVVDIQKQNAQLDFDRAQAGRDAQAVQAGAFGGSRRGVVDALAQEDLMRTQGEIQAQGLQNSFDSAADLFGRDRAANMGREAEMAAEQGRVQSGTLDYGRLGLGASELLSGQAGNLAQMGGQERDAAIQQAQLLEAIGADKEGQQQQGLDIGYEDYLNQNQYGRQQLSDFSSLLRGNTLGPNTTTQFYQNQNPLSQLLGGGITALSLNRAFQ